MNDATEVVFQAGLVKGGEGVFTSSHGKIKRISDTAHSAKKFTDFRNANINNNHTVAFFARNEINDYEGIFTGYGGAITRIADNKNPWFDGFSFAVTINEPKSIPFAAALKKGGSGLFVGTDKNIRTIADTNGPFVNFMETGFSGRAIASSNSLNSQ